MPGYCPLWTNSSMKIRRHQEQGENTLFNQQIVAIQIFILLNVVACKIFCLIRGYQ